MIRAPSGKIYVLEDAAVDTGRVALRRGGEEHNLRPKTFHVLVYLIEHRNRLVPKEELMEHLWPGTAVSDGALAQCIADIRRVLGEDPRTPRYIRTAARLGYQFIGRVEEAPSSLPPIEEAAEPRPEASEESGEDFVEQEAAIASSDRTIPPPKHRRQRWTLLALSVAVIGIVGIAAAWTYLLPSPQPQWEVAWWKLNEGSGTKISDSVKGLPASLPAGVSWTSGISGSALFFSGPDYVHGSDARRVLPSGTVPRTLMAWIKSSRSNGGTQVMLVEGDIRADLHEGAAFSLALDERGAARMGTGHFVLNGTEPVDDDRWHQVAGVFNGAESREMHLFVDGAEQSSIRIPGPLVSGELSEWAMGTGFDGGTMHASIDDSRVYGRALRPDEIRGLYRCVAGVSDIDIDGGGSYYFVPIHGNTMEVLPRRPGEKSAGVRNTGKDFSGAMFVHRDSDCALRSVHGADLGQDLNIEMELLVPAGPGGTVTGGGPYLRSRRANPGDGIVGGTSAGVWIALESTGHVRVRRLNPGAVLGVSDPPSGFDPSVFHTIAVAAHGEHLEVALDGRSLTFEIAGNRQSVLQIPPLWENLSPKGLNGGSAGVAFHSLPNRAQAGGQEARNIRITPYHSLRASTL